jgi:energy-converting hydrogenase Eha subunit C
LTFTPANPSINKEANMTLVFNVVLHGLLISSLLLFVGAVFLVTLKTEDPLERAIRFAALFCGAMVVLGAQAAGANYADFILRAVSNVRPVSFGVFGAVLPASAGIAVGWYFTSSIKKSSNLGIRILGFIGMLASTQFLQVYAVAVSNKGVELKSSAVPNISFMVGLILYIVTKWEPGNEPIKKTGAIGKFQKMAANKVRTGK